MTLLPHVPRLLGVCTLLAVLASVPRPAGAAAQANQPAESCRTPVKAPVIQGEGARVDAFLRRAAEVGAFSGSVFLSRRGEVLVHQGYGLARREQCTLAGPETLYHIGSLAKQFAAAGALRLEEMGRWRLEDPIGRHFPGLPADKEAITVHHLLTHTSGLPPDVAPYGPESDSLDRAEILERIFAASLESKPGTTSRYSNAGYGLLTALIERVSGEPFPDFVQRELFAPAGLTHTAFAGTEAARRNGLAANGFWGRYEVEYPSGRALRWALMPGEVLSTVGDLARWYRELRSGSVLSASSVQRMFTPHAGDYGYGWHVRLRDDGTVSVVFHNGDQDQYAVALRHYPTSDILAVAATNLAVQDAKQHDDILNGAVEVLEGQEVELLPPPASPDGPPPVSGIYRDGEATVRIFRDPGGASWLAPLNAAAFTRLHAHQPDSRARREAAVESTRSVERELRETAAPCDPDEGSLAATRQYVGDWRSIRCDLEAVLGSHREAIFIGAQPLSWSPTRTLVFTRHEHERGDRVVTWLWDADRLVEVWQSGGTELPQAVRLAPSGNAHVSFDWFGGSLLPVRVERRGDGWQVRMDRHP